MTETAQRATAIQWVMLLFVMMIGGFLAFAGWKSGEFGSYSGVIMADLALAGMIVRSIFKNTDDKDTPNESH